MILRYLKSFCFADLVSQSILSLAKLPTSYDPKLNSTLASVPLNKRPWSWLDLARPKLLNLATTKNINQIIQENERFSISFSISFRMFPSWILSPLETSCLEPRKLDRECITRQLSVQIISPGIKRREAYRERSWAKLYAIWMTTWRRKQHILAKPCTFRIHITQAYSMIFSCRPISAG